MSLSFQFETAWDALKDGPRKRKPKRIRTLGSLELESKVELVATEQVDEMIQRIRTLSDGICKVSTREQFHTVFAENANGYHGVVLVDESDYVGIRSKNTGELIKTPELCLPAYVRNETVVAPSDENYVQYLRNIFRTQKIGSFDKRCTDVAFWVNENSFTATVSIVDKPDTREGGCYQLELEFDGHMKDKNPPGVPKILDDFEKAYRIAFGTSVPSVKTKLEWIANKNGHEDVVPKYTLLDSSQSQLLTTS